MKVCQIYRKSMKINRTSSENHENVKESIKKYKKTMKNCQNLYKIIRK